MKTSTAPTTSVTWTQKTPTMWVARQHGDFVATIEQLHVFVVTGPSGDVIGTYSTLDDAQPAIEHPATTTSHHRHRGGVRRSGRRIITWTFFGVIPFAGLCVFGGLLITRVV